MKFLERLRILCLCNRGGALVELAFITPLLLLITMGAVDIGRAGYVGLEVQNAAHAGAEYGSLNPSDTTGITAAARGSAPNVTLATPTVSWGCECSDGTSYSASCGVTPTCTSNSTRGSNVVHRITVTTSASFSPLIPWPGIANAKTTVLTNAITLSGTATIRGN